MIIKIIENSNNVIIIECYSEHVWLARNYINHRTAKKIKMIFFGQRADYAARLRPVAPSRYADGRTNLKKHFEAHQFYDFEMHMILTHQILYAQGGPMT